MDRLDIIFQNPDGDEQLVEFPLSTDYERGLRLSLRPGERFQDTVLFGSKGGGVTHL